jgi:uroporphyrinogen decarboxylase
MKPNPDYTRLVTTLWGGEANRVPLLELIVDPEIKSAYLGRPISTVADDIEFWHQAGYDCAVAYPDSPSMWFFLEEERSETILEDAHTATGYRRWASEGKGLIRDWTDLERYPVPSVDEIDFSYFDAAGQHLPDGMGLIGAWGDIFTYTWEGMGFQEFCFALYEREDFVAHIFNQLGQLAVEICEVLVSYDTVKAFWFSDDIAYRTGLLISPSTYRQYLFPWLTKMGDICRKASLPFIFHSDGVLWEVLDDLTDCGISALHPIEPISMDILEVKRRYGDRLCLVGNVEVDTLSRGTPEEVRDEVRTLLREVAPGGGYCIGSSNTVPNYARLENYKAMIEEAWQFGRYPIQM